LFVCVFVCDFVGPPYYNQRAVFSSPLSVFHFKIFDSQKLLGIVC